MNILIGQRENRAFLRKQQGEALIKIIAANMDTAPPSHLW